ncbi:ankyrin repeat-containing domain, PGG domain protein [Artemisia annua]|uniref:Ankyrin repeat-containing domain, PGG domain protein n=1 Tax=Artemisia annua TaxID=35608 RepID=A0A2U1L1W9_ARTAN|nr:ankyrin repeat-containing domain, PGG domain protein [Artemisia annua]
MGYNQVITDIPIYKAALLDDWDSVSHLFEKEPDLMTKQITYWWETPLMIAVGTNRSNRFVKKLVERIVEVGAKDKLFVPNFNKNGPLHYAAKVGNTTAAQILVEQDPSMALNVNPYGNTPVKLAAWNVNKETLRYLLSVTPDLGPGEENANPYRGVAGGDLITLTIMAGFYDVVSDIIDKHPNIVLENDRNGQTALQVLALKPEIFPSGSRLVFWGRFIYSYKDELKSYQAQKSGFSTKHTLGGGNPWGFNEPLGPLLVTLGWITGYDISQYIVEFTSGFWSALGYMAPTIKKIHDMKVNHNLSSLLVKRICKIIIDKGDHDIAWRILGSAISTAITSGTHELIEECIVTYPGIIWYNTGIINLFIEAMKQRQERVYNLIYPMSRHQVFVVTQLDDAKNENTLHMVAKLAPFHRLNVVTGAALQMQRELQWFLLLEKGQQWMKDTASSCTVVAALVVTMAFAAAFTVPGGNRDNGQPLFLDKGSFMLFIVADAIALFSSTTSVLMFLRILTSRYAEGDFLYALPKRLTIGLLSLFMSLAATLIAFSATLALVLQDKVTWIAAPLVIATSIPVCLFGLLQFPLLVELVHSTYGRSIFHKQNERMIH